jgi:hypothetical protein
MTPIQITPTLASLVAFCLLLTTPTASTAEELTLVHADDFSGGADAWFPSQASRWEVVESGDGHAYRLTGKADYNPPHRSPHAISLLEGKVLGDFVLTAKVKTLQRPTGHRDMCIFFGYQNPSQFYYVHLGQEPDPHSSQIFIVNEAPRTKITSSKDSAVGWKEDTWHEVKLVRSVEDGLIELYFDDMETPQKVAHDKTFTWGLIGLGSFDDPGEWTDIKLHGTTVDGEPILFEPVTD